MDAKKIEDELIKIEYFWEQQYKSIVDMENVPKEVFAVITNAEKDVKFLLELLQKYQKVEY